MLFVAFCALAVLISRYAAVCAVGSQNNEIEQSIEDTQAQIEALQVDMELRDNIDYIMNTATDEMGNDLSDARSESVYQYGWLMVANKAKRRSGGMTAPTLKTKKRLLFLMTVIIVLLIGLAVKMGIIMFVQGEQLQQKALLQQTRDLVVAAKRGEILDCNGNVLAQSANAQAVVVRPSEISD